MILHGHYVNSDGLITHVTWDIWRYISTKALINWGGVFLFWGVRFYLLKLALNNSVNEKNLQEQYLINDRLVAMYLHHTLSSGYLVRIITIVGVGF